MTSARAGADGRWWEKGWVLALLCLSTTAPMWAVKVPPLIDLISHMGRYRVQLDLATSPLLQRNYDFQWALVGNLGVDLIIGPLARLMGLERAVWLVATALPPLMAWGFLRAARAVHGRVPGTALFALPLALAYPWQYGFVNYWLGTALAFHAFATWIDLYHSSRQRWLRPLLFVPIGGLVWLCHVYAWGILSVLAGGAELARGWAAESRRTPAALARIAAGAVGRCWPLMLPLVVMPIWRHNGEGATTLGWFQFVHKLGELAHSLRDQWFPLDIASLLILVLVAYFGLRDRRTRFDARLGLPALFFLILVVLLPYQLFGSAYADSRLWPIVFASAVLATALKPEHIRLERWLAAGAVALLAVRLVTGVVGFARYDRDYTSHLKALDLIQPGSRVVVLTYFGCDRPWRLWRTDHLGSMALTRRLAFVNTQWDVPGAQLLRMKGAPGSWYNADPSQFVHDFGHCHKDMRPFLTERIEDFPRDRFQYAWIFGFDPATLPQYPGLRRLYADKGSVLYEVEGGGAR